MSNGQLVQPFQQCDASSPCTNGVYTLYPASDFQQFPAMTWLIDDILPSTGLACVYGPSGVGKSFFSLDMAAAVALGRPWFGRPSKQAQVVYIPLEGRGGFSRRMKAWEHQHGVNFPDEVKFVQDPFAINKNDNVTMLAEVIVQSGGAGLIIIDTLNMAAPGADENSSTDMGKIIAGARTIQEKTGALVLLIHHPGKDGSRGLRGHSSLHAALDSILELRKDGELIRWSVAKSKDGEDGINHAFKLLQVEVGSHESGKAIKSCVVQEVEGAVASVMPSQPTGSNQKVILGAAREILNQRRMDTGMEASDVPEGMAFDDLLVELKDVLADAPTKHRKQRTKEALEALIRQGYLLMIEDLVCLPIND